MTQECSKRAFYILVEGKPSYTSDTPKVIKTVVQGPVTVAVKIGASPLGTGRELNESFRLDICDNE